MGAGYRFVRIGEAMNYHRFFLRRRILLVEMSISFNITSDIAMASAAENMMALLKNAKIQITDLSRMLEGSRVCLFRG